MLSLVALLPLVAAAAQLTVPSSCEFLVDDMSPRSASNYRNDSYGNVKTLNLNGGDYGVDGDGSKLTYNFAATDGHVDVTPGFLQNPPNTDPGLHPADILANNYFYFKFVWDDQRSSNDFGVKVCQDMTPYQGLYLNVSMPAGSDVYLTLTQKNADCSARTKDSAYVKLSQFHTPNGTPQAIFIPFSLMAKEFDGVNNFDFKHTKDATFVNFNPPSVTYSFYHIGLVKSGASCTPSVSGSTNTGAASTGTTGTGSNGAVSTAAQGSGKSSGEKVAAGFAAMAASVALLI